MQVCARLDDPAIRARELGALARAMRDYRIDDGVLLTLVDTEDVPAEAGEVRVPPAWRWMLEPEELP